MRNRTYWIASALVILGVSLITFSGLYLLNSEPQNSIVKVLNPNNPGNGGTGFVIRNKEGKRVIITNEHVCAVNNANTMVIETRSGRSYIKNILNINYQRDLCVIEGVDLPALNLSDTSPIPYNLLTVYGNPFLNPTQPSKGVFVGNTLASILKPLNKDGHCESGGQYVETMFFTACVMQYELSMTTVPIYPGSSGSPVLNESNQVVGVMNAGDNISHYGLYIPLQYLREALGYSE